MGEPRFQTRHVNGLNLFWNSSTGNRKRGGIQYFVVVQWGEVVKVGQFFLNQLQKSPLQTLTLQNINSLTIAVTFSYSYKSWLIIMWSTFFISFLLLFSSTTSSGFRPIFTLHNMDFLFEIKIVSYSLVNYFLVLGIQLQTGRVCLCIWNINLLLVISVLENYNSLSAYRVRGLFVQTRYI